jgi:hypothetical protein
MSAPSSSTNISSASKLFSALPALIVIYALASALVWQLVHGFEVSNPAGFDPLRFEYYAEQGLPPQLAEFSSYRVVFILQYVYDYLPTYWGFILCLGFLSYAAIHLTRQSDLLAAALLSPITFYYFGQTGKDGISILSFSCFAVLLLGDRRVGFFFFTVLLVALAVYVRPTNAAVLLVLFFLIRRGWKTATFAAIAPSLLFLVKADLSDVLEQTEETIYQEDSGELVRQFRVLTFGFEPAALAFKFVLYLGSLFFQPIAAIIKATGGGVELAWYILFEGVCLTVFLALAIASNRLGKVVLLSIPFALLLALGSPFYHFRYLELLYPVLFILANKQDHYGSAARSVTARSKQVLL